jgi:hypothetical protein
MFRSSVAAFYALPECLFYSFAGPVRRDRFHLFRLLLPIRSEVEKVVHCHSRCHCTDSEHPKEAG